MSNHVSEPSDLHPVDQLAPLLAGELTLAELRAVVGHIRHCPVCQAELVEVAAGYGALQGVAREGLTDLAEPPPLAVHPIDAVPVRPVEAVADGSTARRAGPRRALTVVAAAVAALVLVLAGALVGTRISEETPIAEPPTTATTLPDPIATVEMIRKGAIEANGTLAMAEVPGTAGAEQVMSVDTSALPPAPDGYFYEVWLLQPETGQMLAVGVLPDGGTASFPLSADLIANYQAVDISKQPDDGSIVHSGDSILRGTYA